ncbi:hypothetical protein EDC56_2834 [Sinobacterium caligoides]|uniref:Uncharacterized protein n=1 Tax=Sinobacterium caligoides TaxID=933926 RepID=A0A3N2DK74_9GAMM|nr:hypothetical protein [Sinobacterium caligoides]ROS00196.1 hypothetical protein EDC56_2834 [Sinobacterium caligoides]
MIKRLFASRKRPYIPFRDQPERVQINLSGTIITMDLLPHMDYEGFKADHLPTHVNVFDDKTYNNTNHLPVWQRSDSAMKSIHARDWELLGPPWRSRPFGSITFAITLMRTDQMPEAMSCFNPAHFEQLVLRSAHSRGPASPEYAKVKAPVNWRLHEQNGNTWIYYETRKDFSDFTTAPLPFSETQVDSTLHIPLGDRHYLFINFSYLGYAPAKYSFAHMNKIRDAVCKSIECQLSPSAQQQLISAREQWPTAKAQPEREPEPWRYPEWRRGDRDKGEEDILIIKPGSPAPSYNN